MMVRPPPRTAQAIGTLLYGAAGVLVYQQFYRPEDGIPWADPLVYLIVIFWPLALIAELAILVLGLVAIAIGVPVIHRRLERRRDRGNRP